jgi:outer membrane protein assembly factor BamB
MSGGSDISKSIVFSSPSIDKNGTIYVGDSDLVDGCFYAINANGTLKWRYEHNKWTHSSPAIADDGTIYFGCDNGVFYALNPDGKLKWKLTSLGQWLFSPAIADDGTIYVGSTNGYFPLQ